MTKDTEGWDSHSDTRSDGKNILSVVVTAASMGSLSQSGARDSVRADNGAGMMHMLT